MSNSWFAFRQFTVHQDRCAMKVSTDACIQGALTPLPDGPVRVLDVGTGTGLLSLMIAQRNKNAVIDAIEIDPAAAAQASDNVAASPFADRIIVHEADAKTFFSTGRYDLVICNPPFFRRSLLGPDDGRNAARHDLHLRQEDILTILDQHLADSGHASILLPVPEMDQWIRLAESSGWTLCDDYHIKDNDNARVHRRIGIFGRDRMPARSGIIVIKGPDKGYTEYFARLLAPFYLRL